MPDLQIYNATNDSLDALKGMTKDMVEAGEEVTKRWSTLWNDGLNYICNNQLVGKGRKEGWPAIQVNYIWPAVRQQWAIEAERRPLIVAIPYQNKDADIAAFWQGILQYQFKEDLNIPMLGIAASVDAAIYGMYIAKTFWEPEVEWDADAKMWKGAPRTNLVWPPFFGCDPEAEKVDTAAYVYSKRRVAVDWAITRWPEYEDEIKTAALEDFDADKIGNFLMGGLQKSYDDDRGTGIPDNPNDGRLADLITRARGVNEYGTKPTDDTGRPQYVTLSEIYFRDYSTTKQEEVEDVTQEELLDREAIYKDDEGIFRVGNVAELGSRNKALKEGDVITRGDWPARVTREYDEPDFPWGRMVFKAGETILNPEEEDQVYPYRKWPFTVGVHHVLPHIWQGMNAVEMPRGLQDWINIGGSHILNYVKYFGDPITIIEDGGLAEGKKLNAAAGAVWRVKKMSKVRREPPPPASQGLFQAQGGMIKEIQEQLASSEVARGQTAAGRQTATEIATLQQSAMISSSLQLKQKDEWVRRIMQIVAELDQVNMKPGQMVRIAGDKFEDIAATYTEEHRALKFDVNLKIGTSLPFDTERKKQDAERLAAVFGPIVVAQEILDAFEVENKDEMLEKIEEYQAFQQWRAEQMEAAEAAEEGTEAVGEAGGALPVPPEEEV